MVIRQRTIAACSVFFLLGCSYQVGALPPDAMYRNAPAQNCPVVDAGEMDGATDASVDVGDAADGTSTEAGDASDVVDAAADGGPAVCPAPVGNAGQITEPASCLLTPYQTGVRIANFAPDAPDIDFCLERSDAPGMFFGPVLRRAGINNGNGLPFRRLSMYLPIGPGRYRMRLVAASRRDCEQPLITGSFDGSPLQLNQPIREHRHHTVMLVGMVSPTTALIPALSARVLEDRHVFCGSDSEGMSANCARRLRPVPVVPDLMSFGLSIEVSGALIPVAETTGFAEAGTSPLGNADCYRYGALPSVGESVPVAVYVGGSTMELVRPRPVIPLNFRLASAFLTGLRDPPSTNPRLRLSITMCDDFAVTAEGFSNCTQYPTP